MQSRARRPRLSGESREAFGSKSEKRSGHNVLGPAAEFPEPFASRAKRSGRIAQGLELARSSADFRSDSRGEEFFRQAPKRSSRSSTVGILSSLTLAKAMRTKRSWPAPNMSPGMVSRFSSSARRLLTSVERWPAKGCST